MSVNEEPASGWIPFAVVLIAAISVIAFDGNVFAMINALVSSIVYLVVIAFILVVVNWVLKPGR